MDAVWMFSGQGAQKPGMGAGVADNPAAREVYECASDHFGFDVARTSLEASQEELNETKRAQACMVALSVGLARALEARGHEPSAVLGFSLGQVSALAVSGMLSLEETMRFAAFRAEAMSRAAANGAGAMCALLGADEEAAAKLCDACADGDVLVPANYNCPGQIVISGSEAAIARAEEAWKAEKKRCSRLATSGAFHSPLMQSAADELAAYLAQVEFSEARIPLVCNVDAQPLAAAAARQHLADHLTHPVRFAQSVAWLAEQGACTFAEVGFGGVLSGLVRRIDKNLGRPVVASLEDVESYGE